MSVEHQFEEGDCLSDKQEPTPSPEKNLVLVLEVTGKRADEYVVEETGKTVYEHNKRWCDTGDEPVVIGAYTNMDDDKEFAFPESRLMPP